VVAFATAGRAPDERDQIVRSIQEGAHEWAVHNFASGCEVGDMLVRRLDVNPSVRGALAQSFVHVAGWTVDPDFAIELEPALVTVRDLLASP
jgi:hypothetical protein